MKKSKVMQNIVVLVVLIAAVVLVKLLLGTRTFMYLSATQIDHVTVSTTAGQEYTSTGDDTAKLVNILRKVVTRVPANGTPEGDLISLTICKKDGTVMALQVSGEVFTADGKVYKARAADGAAVADWVAELAGRDGTLHSRATKGALQPGLAAE